MLASTIRQFFRSFGAPISELPAVFRGEIIGSAFDGSNPISAFGNVPLEPREPDLPPWRFFRLHCKNVAAALSAVDGRIALIGDDSLLLLDYLSVKQDNTPFYRVVSASVDFDQIRTLEVIHPMTDVDVFTGLL